MDKEEFNKYDNEVLDIDEISGTDVKINPDYYIHNALVKAQESLNHPNLSEGFARFRIFIEHIEILCTSANMLSNDYNLELDKYKNSQDYIREVDSNKQGILLANLKLKLLMKEVFSKKVAVDSLKA